MLSKKAPWVFGLLALFMFALRVGFKYYRSQQRSEAQLKIENAYARKEALVRSIEAEQNARRANGARVVASPTDTAVTTTDPLAQAK
ncbi:hypothetical protein IC235_12580 [Hymenobacter sp. BT664]|uniref:Uncharacterized protein n=1 Tax=Hymenobacter montanus TaxID=2771359 RepID=A0A927BET5_9BACT|nr:hypothetical protein [Hymenobacter montanus]MBD2768722.1 hypothetical protein [Hymenobacter montanus]